MLVAIIAVAAGTRADLGAIVLAVVVLVGQQWVLAPVLGRGR